MMTDEFQQIWKSYDIKLEKSLQLNLRLLKDMQTQKARSVLRSLVVSRSFMIVFGILWELLLAAALYYVRTQPVMAVSFAGLLLFNGIAIVEYIRDVVAIQRISFAEPITEMQARLSALQSSIIRTLRLIWLQTPFWSTFFISNELLRVGGRQFLVVQIPITLFLIAAAIFLYRNITVENAFRKKWVMTLIRGSGSKSVARAMDFIKEIEDFKKDNL